MVVESSTSSVFTLPSDREIVGSRVFDAPKDLVFKTYTDPTLMPEWWGPARYKTTVDEMDLRPGGAWRVVLRGDEVQHAFSGEFREVVPPERLVFTFNYEPMPGHEAVETITCEEERPGQTKVTDRLYFQNREDRDGAPQPIPRRTSPALDPHASRNAQPGGCGGESNWCG